MNKPVIDRSVLRRHIAAIEAAYPIRILGLLPTELSPRVPLDEGVVFLAQKGERLSLLTMAKAQVELSEKLGRPVAIVLRSGLRAADLDTAQSRLSPL